MPAPVWPPVATLSSAHAVREGASDAGKCAACPAGCMQPFMQALGMPSPLHGSSWAGYIMKTDLLQPLPQRNLIAALANTADHRPIAACGPGDASVDCPTRLLLLAGKLLPRLRCRRLCTRWAGMAPCDCTVGRGRCGRLGSCRNGTRSDAITDDGVAGDRAGQITPCAEPAPHACRERSACCVRVRCQPRTSRARRCRWRAWRRALRRCHLV